MSLLTIILIAAIVFLTGAWLLRDREPMWDMLVDGFRFVFRLQPNQCEAGCPLCQQNDEQLAADAASASDPNGYPKKGTS